MSEGSWESLRNPRQACLWVVAGEMLGGGEVTKMYPESVHAEGKAILS